MRVTCIIMRSCIGDILVDRKEVVFLKKVFTNEVFFFSKWTGSFLRCVEKYKI